MVNKNKNTKPTKQVKTAGDSTRVTSQKTQKEYTYAYGIVEPRATCGLDEFLMGSIDRPMILAPVILWK